MAKEQAKRLAEWMRDHPEEVSKVLALQSTLEALPDEYLEELAAEVGVSTVKHHDAYRAAVIAEVLRTAPREVQAIVSASADSG